jgi:hypothetical protein
MERILVDAMASPEWEPGMMTRMTAEGWWLMGGVAGLVIFVFLEGRRQARRYGPPSARPNLLGVGMLEVQRQLQADRHVEVLQKQNKAELAAAEDQGVGTGQTPDGLKGAGLR